MNPEKIDAILKQAKSNKSVDLYNNDLRPIIGYLKDDVRAIILYDEKLFLTEIGYEILNIGGWIKYNNWLTTIKKVEFKKN